MSLSLEELKAIYEAEVSEKDAIQAKDEIVRLLAEPGWHRVQEWLSARRDFAFQELRKVQGDPRTVAESFWKWQAVDLLYEDIENFIKQSIATGEDILRRQTDTLQESFLRGEIYGRSDTGASAGSAPAGTDPAQSGTSDSY